MELRQLKYFISTVEHGSVTGAAKACHIAQPSISQQLRLLEDELGEVLLKRQARGVSPTDAGLRLLKHARRVLGECEAIEREFHPETQSLSGTLAIGIIPTIAPYLTPGLVRHLHAHHPDLNIEISEGRTGDLIRQVVADELECAIVSDITASDRKHWSLHVKELFREPLILAAPEGHPLAIQRAAPQAEALNAGEMIFLKDGHCLLDQTLKVCRIKRPDQRLQCDQIETALALVSSGAGVAVVPSLTRRKEKPDGVVFRDFAHPRPTRVISLMRRRMHRATARWEALIACLKEMDEEES